MVRKSRFETAEEFSSNCFRFPLSSALVPLLGASLLLACLPSGWFSASSLPSHRVSSSWLSRSQSSRGPLYAISGAITPATVGSGTTISLNGAASATTTANGSGNYAFRGLVNGRYAVTPDKSGYSFSPSSQAVTISNVDVTDVNFTATAVHSTYSILGVVNPARTGAETTITLSGAASLTTIANASGEYSFSGLSNGSYTVTPSKQKATFSPTSQAVTVKEANVTGVNFTIMMRGSE